jgi:hypothetical protein
MDSVDESETKTPPPAKTAVIAVPFRMTPRSAAGGFGLKGVEIAHPARKPRNSQFRPCPGATSEDIGRASR